MVFDAVLNIKLKCWNNELENWDECAYPLFEGLNPCKVIGFQDDKGYELLIKDGHVVELFTGLKDVNKNEAYNNDVVVLVGTNLEYLITYNEDGARWGINKKNGLFIEKETYLLNGLEDFKIIGTYKNGIFYYY